MLCLTHLHTTNSRILDIKTMSLDYINKVLFNPYQVLDLPDPLEAKQILGWDSSKLAMQHFLHERRWDEFYTNKENTADHMISNFLTPEYLESVQQKIIDRELFSEEELKAIPDLALANVIVDNTDPYDLIAGLDKEKIQNAPFYDTLRKKISEKYNIDFTNPQVADMIIRQYVSDVLQLQRVSLEYGTAGRLISYTAGGIADFAFNDVPRAAAVLGTTMAGGALLTKPVISALTSMIPASAGTATPAVVGALTTAVITATIASLTELGITRTYRDARRAEMGLEPKEVDLAEEIAYSAGLSMVIPGVAKGVKGGVKKGYNALKKASSEGSVLRDVLKNGAESVKSKLGKKPATVQAKGDGDPLDGTTLQTAIEAAAVNPNVLNKTPEQRIANLAETAEHRYKNTSSAPDSTLLEIVESVQDYNQQLGEKISKSEATDVTKATDDVTKVVDDVTKATDDTTKAVDEDLILNSDGHTIVETVEKANAEAAEAAESAASDPLLQTARKDIETKTGKHFSEDASSKSLYDIKPEDRLVARWGYYADASVSHVNLALANSLPYLLHGTEMFMTLPDVFATKLGDYATKMNLRQMWRFLEATRIVRDAIPNDGEVPFTHALTRATSLDDFMAAINKIIVDNNGKLKLYSQRNKETTILSAEQHIGLLAKKIEGRIIHEIQRHDPSFKPNSLRRGEIGEQRAKLMPEKLQEKSAPRTDESLEQTESRRRDANLEHSVYEKIEQNSEVAKEVTPNNYAQAMINELNNYTAIVNYMRSGIEITLDKINDLSIAELKQSYKPGNPIFEKIKNMQDLQRKVMGKYGVEYGEIENYLPQAWSPVATETAGLDHFVKNIFPLLDIDKTHKAYNRKTIDSISAKVEQELNVVKEFVELSEKSLAEFDKKVDLHGKRFSQLSDDFKKENEQYKKDVDSYVKNITEKLNKLDDPLQPSHTRRIAREVAKGIKGVKLPQLPKKADKLTLAIREETAKITKSSNIIALGRALRAADRNASLDRFAYARLKKLKNENEALLKVQNPEQFLKELQEAVGGTTASEVRQSIVASNKLKISSAIKGVVEKHAPKSGLFKKFIGEVRALEKMYNKPLDKKALGGIYDSITTSEELPGIATTSVKPSMSKQSRVMFFKDLDAFEKANNLYGEVKDLRALTSNHLVRMVRTIARVKTLETSSANYLNTYQNTWKRLVGNRPPTNWEKFLNWIVERNINYVAGGGETKAVGTLGAIGEFVFSLIRSASLGGAGLTAITEDAQTSAFVGSQHGIPIMKTIKAYVKGIVDSKITPEEAAKMYTHLEQTERGMHNELYRETTNKTAMWVVDKTRKLNKWTYKLNGMTHITQRGMYVFNRTFFDMVGNLQDNPKFEKALRKYGLKDSDFRKINSLEKDADGVVILTEEFRETSTSKKLFNALNTERRLAIAATSQSLRAALGVSGDHGISIGIMNALFFLKRIPTQVFIDHTLLPVMRGEYGYAAKFMVQNYMITALRLTLKYLAMGYTPRLDDANFYREVLMQGSYAPPLFKEFVERLFTGGKFNMYDTYKSIGQMGAGPYGAIMGLGNDIFSLGTGKKNVGQVGRNVLMGFMPLKNHPAVVALFERYVFDNMLLAFDPDAHMKLLRREKNRFEKGFRRTF